MNDQTTLTTFADEDLDGRARTFWSWFQRAEAELRNLNSSSPQVREIDAQLARLGVGSWEVGPAVATAAKYCFALSPDGDPALYRRTRRIVALAPVLKDWEFLPAKPRKLWKRAFRWSERQIPLDASSWRFVVDRDQDGLSEIVLIGDVLAEFGPEEQRLILTFVLESELGENSFMELLRGVDIVREPTQWERERSIPTPRLFHAIVAGRNVQ
jgi:hypothetical protein